MTDVLIVEDDACVRGALDDLLRAVGYRSMTARDGASALASLRVSQMPTVVLLDLMLPVTSGVALLNALDADPALAQRCAVVVLTAYSQWGVEVAALRANWTTLRPSVRGTIPVRSASVLTCVLVKPASLRQLTRAITGAADHLAARSTSDAGASFVADAHEGVSQ
jgi:CheY-like chemotaxis protein